jgi:NADH dehydrogenase
VTWLTIHIFFLIGFGNRLSVFRQWAWTYLTLREGARLITGSQELPGWNVETGSGETVAAKPLDIASPRT